MALVYLFFPRPTFANRSLRSKLKTPDLHRNAVWGGNGVSKAQTFIYHRCLAMALVYLFFPRPTFANRSLRSKLKTPDLHRNEVWGGNGV